MTINADIILPHVPTEGGDEHAVFFTKGGQEFRIVLAAPNIWVIHASHVPPEKFEIVLEHPDRALLVFDATVRRDGLSATALTHSLGSVIAHFC